MAAVVSAPQYINATTAISAGNGIASSPANIIATPAKYLAGETASMAVVPLNGTTASVVLTGVSPTPTLSGSGATRTFKVPPLDTDTVLTLTTTDSVGGISRSQVTAQAALDRVRIDGVWKRAYRIFIGSLSKVMSGINLSGAEFAHVAATLPGVYNTDYMYPQTADYTYIAARGHSMIRLPIRWERIQPTRNAALNTAELARLTGAIAAANTAGLKVLVDVHNYARWINSTANGGATLVLGAGLATADLVDLWTRLSTALKGNAGVMGYGLMNEPNSLSSTSGSFTSSSTVFTFDSTVQSWAAEVGSVAVSAVQTHDGANSLAATKSLAVGSSQTIRVNDSATNTLVETSGNTISAWVLVPTGAPGTVWQAHLEMQNSSYSWQAGPNTSLTPGTWARITYTPSSAIWTGHRGIGVQFESTQTVAGSATVYVDTVQQGSLTGAQTESQVWEVAAQACVTAIRANTDTTPIYVPGYQWQGAQNWVTNHPVPWISGTGIIYDAHYYFDRDNSGDYPDTYAAENTDAVSRGYSSLTNRAVVELSRFLDWCTSNSVQGYVSELGWPNIGTTASWNAVGAALYQACAQAKIGIAYWAAGEWYGTTYNLSAYTGTPLNTTTSVAATIEAAYSTTPSSGSSALDTAALDSATIQ